MDVNEELMQSPGANGASDCIRVLLHRLQQPRESKLCGNSSLIVAIVVNLGRRRTFATCSSVATARLKKQ